MGITVTVAIPHYQGLDFLKQAVESALTQEPPPDDILICDDSPSGEAKAVAEAWPGRIRYFRNAQRLGIVGNWNRCLAEVNTSHAVLLNADDMLLTGYLARMRKAAQDHPDATGIFCEAVTMNADSQRSFSLVDFSKRFLWPQGLRKEQALQGEAGLAALMRGDFIFCPSMFYCMGKLGQTPFDARWKMVLDYDLFLRLLLEGHVLLGLRETLFAFRRHGGNHTKHMEKDLTRFAEDVACRMLAASRAEALGWRKAAQAGRRARLVKLHYAYHLLGLFVRGQWREGMAMARAYMSVFRNEAASARM